MFDKQHYLDSFIGNTRSHLITEKKTYTIKETDHDFPRVPRVLNQDYLSLFLSEKMIASTAKILSKLDAQRICEFLVDLNNWNPEFEESSTLLIFEFFLRLKNLESDLPIVEFFFGILRLKAKTKNLELACFIVKEMLKQRKSFLSDYIDFCINIFTTKKTNSKLIQFEKEKEFEEIFVFFISKYVCFYNS